MMWWDGGWSWWAWLLMTVGMLSFWAIVAWAIVALVRSTRHDAGSDEGSVTGPAERILAERYVRGEIDAAEYRQRRADLRRRRARAA